MSKPLGIKGPLWGEFRKLWVVVSVPWKFWNRYHSTITATKRYHHPGVDCFDTD